jgi:hypothetical protein
MPLLNTRMPNIEKNRLVTTPNAVNVIPAATTAGQIDNVSSNSSGAFGSSTEADVADWLLASGDSVGDVLVRFSPLESDALGVSGLELELELDGAPFILVLLSALPRTLAS